MQYRNFLERKNPRKIPEKVKKQDFSGKCKKYKNNKMRLNKGFETFKKILKM